MCFPSPLCPARKAQGGAASRDEENWLCPFTVPRDARAEEKRPPSDD